MRTDADDDRRLGTALVMAVGLLAGCGAPDAAESPSSNASVGSPSQGSGGVGPSASASQTFASTPATAGSETAGTPSASTGDLPSAAATATEAESAPAPAAGPAPLTTAPAPAPAPTIAAPPTTFADPAEVEAQGFATNPLCEVLPVEEAGVLLGAPVRAAVDTASGTGCLWSAIGSDASYLQLQMLGDPALFQQPDGASALTGLGDAAFVAASDGGWTAQARNPDGTFAVQVAGATATRDAAVEGLRRLLERY